MLPIDVSDVSGPLQPSNLSVDVFDMLVSKEKMADITFLVANTPVQHTMKHPTTRLMA